MGYDIDLEVVRRNIGDFVLAIEMTLAISAVAMVLSLVAGLLVALLRVSKTQFLRAPAQAYINFFRGAPQYILIFWVYYGLAMLFKVNFSPFTAGVISLSLQYGASLAEVYRSGIEAVGKGQREAAMATGLTPMQATRYIVLPQAIRIVLPALGNSWISMVKDSSLVSAIGVMDIMLVASLRANDYFRPFEFLTLAALLYIGLTFIFFYVNQSLENRLRMA